MTAVAQPAGIVPMLAEARAGGGWRIALWHYAARGRRRVHPVVLCHGLGANRTAFDLAPDRSLARHLAVRGYDVFCLELRGHGASRRIPGPGPRFGWSFDTYLEDDLPAALARVREATGASLVHWLGHSMGGILLYAHLARTGGVGIRSGIAVGSSLDYSGGASDFRVALRIAFLLRLLPAIPLGPVARASAGLTGRRVMRPFDLFNAWPPNLETELHRRIMAEGFHTVSSPVLAQLATLFEPGGLASADRSRRYLASLSPGEVPVLAIAGTEDRQVAVPSARATAEAAGGRIEIFEDAGHFDLLVGRRAASEVWPVIDAFFDDADGWARKGVAVRRRRPDRRAP